MAREPGLYPGLPEGEYFTDKTALSASEAKVLLGKKPPGYGGATDAKVSDALAFGTLVHRVVLEPDRLDEYRHMDPDRLWLKSDGTPASKPHSTAAYKEAVAGFEAAGKTVVSQDDWDRAHRMRDAVMEHPTARRLIEGAIQTECSAYALHETGAMVRGRFDLIGPGYIADLKTASDPDPASFGRTVANFMYHVSAANYLDIASDAGLIPKPEAFGFINVEKTEPHRVSVCELTAEAIQVGRDLMREACERWLALDKRVELPDFGTGIHRVDLPRWSHIEHENRYQETA